MVATAGSIDYMFAQLSLTGNVWATTIAGFILVLIIVFAAIAVFGKSKQDLGGFGIMIFAFLGTLLATVLGLFQWYVLIVFLVVGLALALITKLIGGKQ